MPGDQPVRFVSSQCCRYEPMWREWTQWSSRGPHGAGSPVTSPGTPDGFGVFGQPLSVGHGDLGAPGAVGSFVDGAFAVSSAFRHTIIISWIWGNGALSFGVVGHSLNLLRSNRIPWGDRAILRSGRCRLPPCPNRREFWPDKWRKNQHDGLSSVADDRLWHDHVPVLL